MRAILMSSGLAVIFSLLGTRLAMGWFTRHGFGQPIRDDGPTTHHVKRGTPTMGGLVILMSATAAYLVATMLTGGRPSASAWLLLLLFLGCGVVGFLDDFIKVYTQNNQGLTSRAKMAGQTVVALGFGLLATQFFADDRGVRPASQYISTTHDWGIKLPLVVVLLVIWFIVTATSNAANLTDGADGLLAGTSAMIFGAYTIVNIWQNNHRCGSLEPTVVESQCYQTCATPSTSRSSRQPSPQPASASSGGTPNRPGSSWATSARSPSEVRWPAWRSCPGPSSS